MSNVKCQMSHITCHMSHVTCHMLHVTCHMSHVTNILSYTVALGINPATNYKYQCKRAKFAVRGSSVKEITLLGFNKLSFEPNCKHTCGSNNFISKQLKPHVKVRHDTS